MATRKARSRTNDGEQKPRRNVTQKKGNANTKAKRVYSKNDFSSGDGMLTTVWGPSIWHFLHTMSFNYPVKPTADDRKHYSEFIKSLQHILPCRHCRENIVKNFKVFPLKPCHMESRATFSRYVYGLHETVNKMLGKKSGLKYCDVRERYEHFRARCTDEKPKLWDVKRLEEESERKRGKGKGTRKGKGKGKGKGKDKEKGCTEPLYGKKAKCVIKIVPQEEKCGSFEMDKRCIKERG